MNRKAAVAACLLACGFVHAAASPGMTPGEAVYEELAEKFVEESLTIRENPDFDPLVLAEAEEMAAIADEILTEADVETATILLTEALELLRTH
ncbi:MAG: hypothetical protein QF819_02265 [Gemmatimonadota bacterium]|jgi:hypothetical protein|nr:hypothetical protein [Gemmatimonadota bacterium]MDP6461733.1 hypothetical protein [Gemmatimonadota bacterium]MDP6530088.1 hypothetical protein [Gemmatimonadota bacterium]MDP6801984.1 hypothetical protein [Gemmatimonadota bacterium]MDP7031332.1 hypothetical protein [Gemmatimonadota bacterium]